MEGPEERDGRLRARNKRALRWIVAACVALAALGYWFAVWLAGRPAP